MLRFLQERVDHRLASALAARALAYGGGALDLASSRLVRFIHNSRELRTQSAMKNGPMK
jgi:hypothetical protein